MPPFLTVHAASQHLREPRTSNIQRTCSIGVGGCDRESNFRRGQGVRRGDGCQGLAGCVYLFSAHELEQERGNDRVRLTSPAEEARMLNIRLLRAPLYLSLFSLIRIDALRTLVYKYFVLRRCRLNHSFSLIEALVLTRAHYSSTHHENSFFVKCKTAQSDLKRARKGKKGAKGH